MRVEIMVQIIYTIPVINSNQWIVGSVGIPFQVNKVISQEFWSVVVIPSVKPVSKVNSIKAKLSANNAINKVLVPTSLNIQSTLIYCQFWTLNLCADFITKSYKPTVRKIMNYYVWDALSEALINHIRYPQSPKKYKRIKVSSRSQENKSATPNLKMKKPWGWLTNIQTK